MNIAKWGSMGCSGKVRWASYSHLRQSGKAFLRKRIKIKGESWYVDLGVGIQEDSEGR